MKLYLASGSPRRSELLQQAGYTFDVVLPDIEECRQEKESAKDYVLRLSYQKAKAGAELIIGSQLTDGNEIVLGSDTVVVLEEQVLEKPIDLQDSKRMLLALSGRKHQVLTAVTVLHKNKIKSNVVVTDVWFKVLTEEEIEQYWQTGEPCDKAGSYGIQGLGGRFVSRIEGSYYAVVGLPLFETDQLLQEFF
ncbi:Maf family protein [Vibrio sp. TH_r3]|uniref:Maf family protein n=1 Tax=Vibrio sp. TH_r3 TaxID=3082084 RepID=UPI0029557CC0|nr:Maf family protein [Vibrio sp. TH_r3]MDV7105953.1 Maf family protein [Vibrio sp. TH_r3]